MRLPAVALLSFALLLQVALLPFSRSAAARMAAFEAELFASMCLQGGGVGVPGKPGRDHCPEMQCCLSFLRSPVDACPAIQPALPQLPPLTRSALRLAWPVITTARHERVSEGPRKARAPPA